MSKEREDHAFGDAVYETWCRGGNPDAVDRDRMADDFASGYEAESVVAREVARCTRRRSPEEQP